MSSFSNDIKNTPGGANLRNCFLCGSCTASCPVSDIDDEYNPRKMMRLVLLDNEEVLKSDEIWKCNQCHACVAHCPQDVRFADVVRSLRETAIEKGYRKQELLDTVLNVDAELRKERLAKVKQALSK